MERFTFWSDADGDIVAVSNATDRAAIWYKEAWLPVDGRDDLALMTRSEERAYIMSLEEARLLVTEPNFD